MGRQPNDFSVKSVKGQTGATPGPATVRRRLLAWYDRHRRDLPWRAAPGATADPYHVWLSEIMLQQTTVAAVQPYFRRFLQRWPTVTALAAADLDAVLTEWQGLGYYARARNLHACARRVSEAHDGRFPDTEDGLRDLPGIGRYTAAAIAAIAFDRPATVVDGNVERVVARLHRVREPLPGSKPRLYDLTATLNGDHRPGDLAQAMMDLGATVCTPRQPDCLICPLTGVCLGKAEAETLPVKAPKKARPVRYGVTFWAGRDDGAVLLRRRPEEGLLGGMMEFPGTPWVDADWDLGAAKPHAPVAAAWQALPGRVVHGFTHFRLELTVLTGTAGPEHEDGVWVRPRDFGRYALPTVMKKVARHVLGS